MANTIAKKEPSLIFTCLLHLCLAAILSLMTNAQAGELGFQYWSNIDDATVDKASKALYNANWPEARQTVQADFDHIASLGGGCVRIMLETWNLLINQDVSDHIRPELYEQADNIVELLHFAQAHGLKVIIAFNNGLLQNEYWQQGWTTNLQGCFEDNLTVINTLINACENSAYADTVLFYDLENETQPADPQYDYAIFLYDNCTAPSSKKGFSVGSAMNYADDFRAALTAGRPLAFADFHSYTDNPQSNPAPAIALMRSTFPEAEIIMGEFGARMDLVDNDEDFQTLEILSRIDAAQTNNLPWYSLWAYIDRPGGLPFGLLETNGTPRNCMEAIAAAFCPATNLGFESGTTGWSKWQDGGDTMTYESVQDAAQAAAGNRYARLTLPAGSEAANIQISTAKFDVPVGANRLFANSFVRGNDAVIFAKMTVKQYDSSGTQIKWHGSPELERPAAEWTSFLHGVGSWSVPLESNCVQAVLTIKAQVAPTASSAGVFEVDSVSVSMRTTTPVPAMADHETFVKVDANSIIRTFSDRPVGANVNFVEDSDDHFQREVSTSNALLNLNVGTLRYPMGEIADNVLFRLDPTNGTEISMCAIRGTDAPKLYNFPVYYDQASDTFITMMNTAEFLQKCSQTDASPFFCIGIDAILKDRSYGQTEHPDIDANWNSWDAASKTEVYTAASNWVEYVKTLGVTGAHWEIGNESYLDNDNVGSWIPEKYAEVVNDLADIIHSIDPSAKVGANGGVYYHPDWWDRVLPITEDRIDFLVVHEYFPYAMADYSSYLNNTDSLQPDIDRAIASFNRLVSPANRNRIRIAITECSSHIAGGYNGEPNNLGKAIQNTEHFGDMLIKPDLTHLHFWITRYLYNGTKFTTGDWAGLYKDSGLLDDDNRPLPMGQSLRLWTHFLHDQMVEARTDKDYVRAYASSRTVDGSLNLFLLNRNTAGETALVALENHSGSSQNNCWRFTGTSTDDVFPILEKTDSIIVSNNAFSIWLAPLSVTIVEFLPDIGNGLQYYIVNDHSDKLLETHSPTFEGTAVQLWSNRGNWEKQRWVFEPDGNGGYEIINQAAADTFHRLEADGTDVIGKTDRGSDAVQQWLIEPDAAGCWTIRNRATGLALDAHNGQTADGTLASLTPADGSRKQRWHIIPYGERTAAPTITELSDFDAWGDTNLFDYACQTAPDINNSDGLSYRFSRRSDADYRGLTYQIEATDNLVSNVWKTIETGATTSASTSGFETVTTQIPADDTNRYFRLKVELNP